MNTATMQHGPGRDPTNVVRWLYAHETRFITRASDYQFQSTAPQAELDAAIAGVIAGQPIPEPVETVNDRSIRQQIQDAMVALGALADSSGTLSGAQLSNGVRLLARSVRRLIRLQLNQLDGAD